MKEHEEHKRLRRLFEELLRKIEEHLKFMKELRKSR